MTAESALVTHLLALVDVFANLHRARSESFIAVALETALDVTTSTVSANICHSAFIIVWNTTEVSNL